MAHASTKTKIGLITGFGISLALMCFLLLLGLINMAEIQERLKTIVELHNVKTERLQQMQASARERTISLYRMVATTDPFVSDEEYMRFSAMAGEFIKARNSFLELELDEQEKTIIRQQGALTAKAVSLQNRVVELANSDRKTEAFELLYTETVPAQDEVFNQLGELMVRQKLKVQAADQAARREYRQTLLITLVFGAVAVLLGVSVAAIVIRRTIRAENTLIDYQQQLEERVEQRTRALWEHARELEDLTYSIAHDLRGPLRGIDGFSLFLQEEFTQQLGATGKDYLKRIRAANLRMSDVIDSLLQITRVIQLDLHKEPVNLSEIAEEICHVLQTGAPGRAADLHIQPGMVCVCDSRQARTLLQQLLENAWKFSEPQVSAKIEFFTDRVEGGEPVYCIRDNGVGFDMQYAGKLFKIFECLHSPGELTGIGVGLAIVARIVSRHEGRIWAESAPGRGASFYFTLGVSG